MLFKDFLKDTDPCFRERIILKACKHIKSFGTVNSNDMFNNSLKTGIVLKISIDAAFYRVLESNYRNVIFMPYRSKSFNDFPGLYHLSENDYRRKFHPRQKISKLHLKFSLCRIRIIHIKGKAGNNIIPVYFRSIQSP